MVSIGKSDLQELIVSRKIERIKKFMKENKQSVLDENSYGSGNHISIYREFINVLKNFYYV